MKICRTPPWASYKITINPGVWMIFLGCGCMCNCVRPKRQTVRIGIVFVVVVLALFPQRRCPRRERQASRTVEPMSKNSLTPGGRGPRPTLPAGGGAGGAGGVAAGDAAGAAAGPGPEPAITPAAAGGRDRFLQTTRCRKNPVAVGGAGRGPSKFGLPSASLGTPGVGIRRPLRHKSGWDRRRR